MSDISISFPPWMIAWFLLGEGTPFITLVLISLAAAFFFSRNTGRIRHAYWLKWRLAIVGGFMAGRDQLLGGWFLRAAALSARHGGCLGGDRDPERQLGLD
jgi:hypothetical protein